MRAEEPIMIAFEEILLHSGALVYKTKGVSMQPMLRQNRDLVIIRPSFSRLNQYDVALYKSGDLYILHRVIGVRDDHYLIRGDNTYVLETVPHEAVIGVLTEFRRKGKQFSVDNRGYKLYVRFWHAIYPLRYGLYCFRRLTVRTARKLGILPIVKRLMRKGNVM